MATVAPPYCKEQALSSGSQSVWLWGNEGPLVLLSGKSRPICGLHWLWGVIKSPSRAGRIMVHIAKHGLILHSLHEHGWQWTWAQLFTEGLVVNPWRISVSISYGSLVLWLGRTGLCVCVYRLTLGVLSLSSPNFILSFFETRFLPEPSAHSLSQLHWLAREPQRASCLFLPVL